jgi:hypothetical protein
VSFGAFHKGVTLIHENMFPAGEVGVAIAAGGRWAAAVTSPSGLVYTWAR